MNQNTSIQKFEKNIKRMFKNKIRYTFAAMISFLLAGTIIFGEEESISLKNRFTAVINLQQDNDKDKIPDSIDPNLSEKTSDKDSDGIPDVYDKEIFLKNPGDINKNGIPDDLDLMEIEFGLNNYSRNNNRYVEYNKSVINLSKLVVDDPEEIGMTSGFTNYDMDPGESDLNIHNAGYGIYINKDGIDVSDGIGIFGDLNDTITNEDVINVSGTGIGILANSSQVENILGAEINVTGGTGIETSNGATFSNEGSINVSGEGSTGIKSSDTEVLNNGSITAADGGVGMGLEGGSLVGFGNITAESGATGAVIDGTTGENTSGEILINDGDTLDVSSGALGVDLTNSKILVDGGNVTVADTGSVGISAGENSTVNIDNGNFDVSSGGTGVLVKNGGSVNILPTGEVSVTGSGSKGLVTEDDISTAENTGTITVDNNGTDESFAMYGEESGSSLSNTGTINLDGVNSVAIGGGYTNYEMSQDELDTSVHNAGAGDYTNAGTINVNNATTGIFGDLNDTLTNTGDINVSAGGTGIKGNAADVENTADGTINVTEGTGIEVLNGGTVANAGAVTADGSSSTGIEATGTGTTVSNSGTVTAKSGGLGISASENAAITNTGTVSVEGDSTGTALTTGADLINSGTINIASNSVGATATGTGTTVTNSAAGTVNVTGDSAEGLVASSEAVVTNAGNVSVTGSGSKGLVTEDDSSTAENTWIITVDNNGTDESFAMYGEESGSSLSNTGTINLDGVNSVAIGGGYTNYEMSQDESDTDKHNDGAGNYTNAGTINVTNVTTGIFGDLNDTITNTENINVSAGGTGIKGNSADVVNTAAGTIDVTEGTGIEVLNGGTVANAGAVTADGSSSTGIEATGTGTTVSNSGTVTAKSGGLGISASENADITNTGTVGVEENSTGAALTTGADLTNSGTVNIASNSVGATATGTGTTVTNSAAGTVNVTGDSAEGLVASSEAVVTNAGNVSVTGSGSKGLVTEDGISTAENTGTITVDNDDTDESFAMYGEESGSSLSNTGTINLEGVNSVAIGGGYTNYEMSQDESDTDKHNDGAGNYTNAGTINVKNATTGIFGDLNDTITNTGNINVSAGGTGIKGNSADVINTADGTINVTNGTGIEVLNGGTVSNNGNINVISDDSTGIKLSGSKSVLNQGSDGHIYVGGETSDDGSVSSANNSTGIYVDGIDLDTNKSSVVGTVTIEGTDNTTGIHLDNGSVMTYGGSMTVSTYGDEINGVGNSQSVKVTSGSEFINEGTLTVNDTENKGVYVDSSSEATNKGEIAVSGNGSYGMYGELGATLVNASKITINNPDGTINVSGGSSGDESFGMYVAGTDSTSDNISLSNQGTINLSGEGSLALGSSVTNYEMSQDESDTDKHNDGAGNYTNAGTINVTNVTTGIFGDLNDTITNTENINVSAGGTGIKGNSADVVNTAAGTIDVTEGTGIEVLNGGTVANAGAVTADGSSSTGIEATGTGTTVSNSGTVTAKSGGLGISASENADITNTGTVGVEENSTGAALTTGADLTNSGTVNIAYNGTGATATGTGTTVTNSAAGTVNVTGDSAEGLVASSEAVVTNAGNVSVTGSGSKGLVTEDDSSTAENTWIITVDNNGTDESFAMYGEESGSSLSNTGTINLDGVNSVAIGGGYTNYEMSQDESDTDKHNDDAGNYTNAGTINVKNATTGIFGDLNDTITNTGNINVSAGGTGIKGNSADVINTADGTINVTNGTGIEVLNGGTVSNNGNINVISDDSTGIKLSGSKSVLNQGSDGHIYVGGETSDDGSVSSANNSTGIYVDGIDLDTNKSSVEGTVTIEGTDNTTGIHLDNGSVMTYGGSMTVSTYGDEINGVGNSQGVKVTSDSEFINEGTLSVNDTDNKGVYVDSSSEATNKGEIAVSGNGSYGMYGELGATLVNASKITIDNPDGTINVSGGSSGDESFGMYVAGTDSTSDNISLSNQGTINLSGEGSLALGSSVTNYEMSQDESDTDKHNDGAGNYTNAGTINVTNVTTGIFGDLNDTITNTGNINVSAGGTGIKGNSADVINTADGTINVTNGTNGTGIEVLNGGTVSNNGNINIISDDSTGIKLSGSKSVLNQGSDGHIYVGGETSDDGSVSSANNSTGIYVDGIDLDTNGSSVVGTVTIEGTDDTTGIHLDNGSVMTYKGSMAVSTYGDEINGVGNSQSVKVTSGSEFINEGTLTVNDTENKGVYVDSSSEASNKGEIVVSGDGSYGLYGELGATLVNASKITIGTINVSGGSSEDESFGMYVAGTNAAADIISLTNQGTINLSGEGSLALGSSVTNYEMSQDESDTDKHNAGEGNYTNAGTININSATTGIFGDLNDTITNTGNINVSAVGAGIKGNSADVVNTATGTIDVTNGTGIEVLNGGTVANAGTVTAEGASSTGIEASGTGTTVSNSGTVFAINGGKGVLLSTGGELSNTGTVSSTTGSTGIDATDGNINNFGIVTTTGSGSTGLKASGTTGTGYEDSDSVEEIVIAAGDTLTVTDGATGALLDGTSATTELVVNDGTVDVSGEGSVGIEASGTNADAQNVAGFYTVSSGATGLLASNGGSVSNSGEIDISGAGTVGMKADYADSTATNNGTIDFSTGGSETDKLVGMYAVDGGTIENTQALDIDSDYSVGMKVEDDSSVLNNSGNISVSGDNSDGILVVNKNNLSSVGGAVIVSGKNSSGIHADNSTLTTNDTDFNVSFADGAENSSLILSDNGSVVTNTGAMNVTVSVDEIDQSNAGIKITGSDSEGNNQGTIKVGSYNTGMIAENGGTAVNDATGTINMASSTGRGMLADGSGSTATNKGIIAMSIDGSTTETPIGIEAVDGGTGINEATFDISAAYAIGMKAEDSTINNTDTINVTGSESIGMTATGTSKIGNEGTINVNTGEGATGIYIDGTGTESQVVTFSSGTDGTINVAGNDSGNNETGIKLEGSNAYVSSGSVGTINVSSDGATGILLQEGAELGSDSESIAGTIKVADGSAAGGNVGIKAETGSKVYFGGDVNLTAAIDGENIGFYAEDSTGAENNTYIENSGTITMGSDNTTIAMKGSGSGATVVNNGIIEIEGESSTAMVIEKGAKGVNNQGTLNIDEDNSVGMEITAATGENNGEINVISNNSTGIKLSGIGSILNQGSEGHIYVGGETSDDGSVSYTADNSTGIYVDGITLGTDSIVEGIITIEGTDNTTGIHLDNGSVMTYSGDMTVSTYGDEINGVGNSQSVKVTSNSEFINEGTLTVNDTDNKGIYVDSSSEATNKGKINVSGNGSYGLYGEAGASLTNASEGTINVSGGSSAESFGMYMDGADSATDVVSLSNDGTINLSGEGAIALGSTVTNYDLIQSGSAAVEDHNAGSGTYQNNGTINVGSDSKVGIFGDLNDTVINIGTVNLNTENTTGLYSILGDISNTGDIISSENGNTGISLIGASNEAVNDGSIVLAGNSSIGVYVSGGANVQNNDLIEIGDTTDTSAGGSSYGIKAESNSTVSSETGANIRMYGDSSYGISGDGTTTIENNGSIEMGYGELVGENFVYTGGDSSYGIYSKTGDSVTNTGNITMYGDSAVGMYRDGDSDISNEGTVTVYGDETKAIASSGTGNTLTNNEIINVKGSLVKDDEGNTVYFDKNNGYEMKLVDNELISITDDTLIYTIDKSGNLYDSDENLLGNINDGYDTGIVSFKNTTYGIYVEDQQTGDNTDTIYVGRANADDSDEGLTGTAYGIYVKGDGTVTESATGTNAGDILVNGDTDAGMVADSVDSLIQNSGNIEVVTDEDRLSQSYMDQFKDEIVTETYGMKVNEGTGENSGNILVATESDIMILEGRGADGEGKTKELGIKNIGYGVYTSGSTSEGTSSGTIDVNSDYSYGMYSTEESTVTNSGTINVQGVSDSYGMYSDKGSEALNTGVINIGDSSDTDNAQESYGMYATSATGGTAGGTLINEGSIEVASGSVGSHSNYGIYVDDNGSNISNTVENRSKINVTGDNSYGIYLENTGTLYGDSADLNGYEGYDGTGSDTEENNLTQGTDSIVVTGEDSVGIHVNNNSVLVLNTAGEVDYDNTDDIYSDTDRTHEAGATGSSVIINTYDRTTDGIGGQSRDFGTKNDDDTYTVDMDGDGIQDDTILANAIMVTGNKDEWGDIYVDDSSKFINSGVLTVNEVNGVGIWANEAFVQNFTAVSTGTGVTSDDVFEMSGVNGSVVESFVNRNGSFGVTDDINDTTQDIYIDDSSTAINSGSIDLTGSAAGTNGVEANGNIVVGNYGEIKDDDTSDSFSLYGINGATVISGTSFDTDSEGSLVITGSVSDSGAVNDIYVDSTSMGANLGTINVSSGDKGVTVKDGSSFENSMGSDYSKDEDLPLYDKQGIINVTGDDSIGIYLEGKEASYVNNGEINVSGGIDTYGNRSFAVYHEGASSMSNDGTITLSGEGSFAFASSLDEMGQQTETMPDTEMSYSNNGTIVVQGNAKYGLWGDSNDGLTNGGSITVNTDGEGYGIYQLDVSEITNNGNITLKSSTAMAMGTDDRDGTREVTYTNMSSGTVTVEDNALYGMYADSNDTLSNEGEVIVKNTGTALYKESNGSGVTLENDGIISLYNTDSYSFGTTSAESEVDNFQNEGTINVGSEDEGDAIYGILGDTNDIIVNNGTVNVVSDNAYALYSEGSTQTGTADSPVVITNDGEIVLTGKDSTSFGSNQDYEKFVNSASGTIDVHTEVENEVAYGMYSDKAGSTSENSGTINVNPDVYYQEYGYTDDMGTDDTSDDEFVVVGSSNIETGSGVGMYAGNSATVTNTSSGVINVYGKDSSGMSAVNGTLINEGEIVADINYSGYEKDVLKTAMSGTDNSTLINTGKIILDDTSSLPTDQTVVHSAYGMYVEDSSTALNQGYIQVGNNSAGMYAKDSTLAYTGIDENSDITDIEAVASITNDTYVDTTGDGYSEDDKGLIMITGNPGSTGDSLEDAVGMVADNALALNKGVIVIDSTADNSVGMKVENNGIIVNTGDIVINSESSDSEAFGNTDGTDVTAIDVGLVNGTVVNYGTVSLRRAGGFGVLSAMSGSNFVNYGTLSSEGVLNIQTDSDSAFVIATDQEGALGTIEADIVVVEGNVELDNGYMSQALRSSYSLDLGISGDTDGLEENISLQNSLYRIAGVSTTVTSDSSSDTVINISKVPYSQLTPYEDQQAYGDLLDAAIRRDEINGVASQEQLDIANSILEDSENLDIGTQNILQQVMGGTYTNLSEIYYQNKNFYDVLVKDLIYADESYLAGNFGTQKLVIDTKDDGLKLVVKRGSDINIEDKQGSYEVENDIIGFVVGNEWKEYETGATRVRKGILVGYQNSQLEYDDPGNSEGSGNLLNAGAYYLYDKPEWQLRTALSISYGSYEIERSISAAYIEESAETDIDTYGISLDTEYSRVYEIKNYNLIPYLGLDLTKIYQNSFEEIGAGEYSVDGKSKEIDSAEGTLGIRSGKRYGINEKLTLSLFTSVEYNYQFSDRYETQQELSSNLVDSKYKLAEADDSEAGSFRYSISLGIDVSNSFSVIGSYSIDDRGNDEAGLILRYEF